MNDIDNFRSLVSELLSCIDEREPFDELYPLMRNVEQKLVSAFGTRNWSGCEMRLDSDNQEIVLRTSHPTLDQYHEARWDVSQPLSADEDNELRKHVARVLRAWLRQCDSVERVPSVVVKLSEILSTIEEAGHKKPDRKTLRKLIGDPVGKRGSQTDVWNWEVVRPILVQQYPNIASTPSK